MPSIEILSDIGPLLEASNYKTFVNRIRNKNENELIKKKGRDLFMLDEKELGFSYGRHVLAVCIPFYNEEAFDMHRTLTSLCTAIKELIGKFSYKKDDKEKVTDVVVIMVGDGYSKVSNSMKKYLCQLMGVKDTDDLEPDRRSVARVVGPAAALSNNMAEDFKEFHKTFKLRLMMKAENAGKANSQEWFLKLAAPSMDCRYVFMTDCGTFFQKDCLMFLLRECIKHQTSCVGVTGHQRVMRWGDQESEYSLHNMLMTFAQGFDYEASQSMFSVPFAAIGSLPVIPGPCGMYNLELLHESGAVDAYFKAIDTDPSKSVDGDLIAGNLSLAEDRILCFEAVKRSQWTHKTHIEPRAVFFFEAETDAERLLQQRRRWINGTVAGYMRSWAILSEQLFAPFKNVCCSFESMFGRLGPKVKLPQSMENKEDLEDQNDHQPDGIDIRKRGCCTRVMSWFRMLASLFLVSLQLIMHCFTLLSIGIFAIAFHFALLQILGQTEALYNVALLVIYIGLNVIFVLLHHRRSLTRLYKPVFYMMLFMNMFVEIVIVIGYVIFLLTTIPNASVEIVEGNFNWLGNVITLIKLLPFVWFFGTLILALMHGFKSFYLWLLYVIPYILLLPTMVSTLPLYAVCRMWELSWGNRPSDPSHKVRRKLNEIAESGDCSQLAKQYLEEGQMSFDKGNYGAALSTLEAARRIIHAEDSQRLISANSGRKWFGRTAATEEGKTRSEAIQKFQQYVKYAKDLQDKCTVLVFVLLLCNALLALLMVEVQNYLASIIVIFTALIFVPVIIFQVIAVFFWLYFLIFKRRLGLYPCWQGFKRCCFRSYKNRYASV